MMKCKITGLNFWHTLKLRFMMMRANLHFEDPVEIYVEQPLRTNCYSSLWYGGDMVRICYKGWTFTLSACGAVKAELLEKEDPEHVLAYVHDEKNLGEFGHTLSKYIHCDKELIDLLGDAHPHYKLYLIENNWWECFPAYSLGHFCEPTWVSDEDDFFGAIIENLSNMDRSIQDMHKENAVMPNWGNSDEGGKNPWEA